MLRTCLAAHFWSFFIGSAPTIRRCLNSQCARLPVLRLQYFRVQHKVLTWALLPFASARLLSTQNGQSHIRGHLPPRHTQSLSSLPPTAHASLYVASSSCCSSFLAPSARDMHGTQAVNVDKTRCVNSKRMCYEKDTCRPSFDFRYALRAFFYNSGTVRAHCSGQMQNSK